MNKELSESWEMLTEKISSMIDTVVLLLPNIFLSIIVAIVGYLAVRFLRNRLVHLFTKTLSNKTMARLLGKVLAFVLMIGVLFLILGILNLHQLLTSLLATAGVLGLAVGLALQGPLANAFGGILLSIRERYNPGDLVKTNDHFGNIKEVNLKSTIMVEPSGQVISIPNHLVLENPIVNYTTLGKRRIELDCGISYAEDLNNVEEVTLKALEGVTDINKNSVDFFYMGFGDSSINFRIWFWIHKVDQASYYHARSQALRLIKKAFDQNGILIPFPIRTLDFGIKGGSPLSQEMKSISTTIQEGGQMNQ